MARRGCRRTAGVGLTDWYRDAAPWRVRAVDAATRATAGHVDFTVGRAADLGPDRRGRTVEHGRPSGRQSVIATRAGASVDGDATRTIGGAYVISPDAPPTVRSARLRRARVRRLENDALEDIGASILVLDLIGGDIGKPVRRVWFEPENAGCPSSGERGTPATVWRSTSFVESDRAN